MQGGGEGGGWEVDRKELSPLYCDFPIVNPIRVGKKVGRVHAYLWY